MQTEQLNRLNELSKKVKSGAPLSPEEEKEREALRKEYIAAFRSSLQQQLDNTYVLDPSGNKRKLQKKQ